MRSFFGYIGLAVQEGWTAWSED